MSPKYINITLQVLLIASISTAVYFYTQYKKIKDTEPGTVLVPSNECPKGMVCKDFRWVDQYIEVVAGEIEWIDCGEGVNKCARWEDYSGENPLPQVTIKGCTQEGTRLENGVWALPDGLRSQVPAEYSPFSSAKRPSKTKISSPPGWV